MRLVTRSRRSPLEKQLDRAQRRRAAAGTFAENFPLVERIRLELHPMDPGVASPVRQLHELFPPAASVLVFNCPHGDCDGFFDLTDAVDGVLRAGAAEGAGAEECRGTRPAPGVTRRPCRLKLGYRFTVTYRAKTG